MNEFYLHVLPVEILQRFRNNRPRRRVQTMVFFFAHFASLFLSLRVLFDVKCTLNVSLSVNCAVLVTEQDTYFQIEENVNFCLMKYLKKLVS